MPTTAWKSAGAGASKSYQGDVAWSNPGNITASDDSRAVGAVSSFLTTSNHLRATNFGFTTSDIPSGATIDGIEVRVERQNAAGAVRDLAVILVKGTADSTADHKGDNKADTTTNWPSTDTQVTYGGATDTWNSGLTDSDIRSTDFGVTLRVQRQSGTTSHGVDHVEIRVHYTAGATYNETISESITAADSRAVVGTFVTTRSEAITASDSNAATAALNPSLSEGLTATDSYSGGLALSGSITESITASDDYTGGLAFNVTISEALTGSDSVTATAVFGNTLSESITGSDSYTGGLLLTGEVSETLAASMSLANLATLGVGIGENVVPGFGLVVTHSNASLERLNARLRRAGGSYTEWRRVRIERKDTN